MREDGGVEAAAHTVSSSARQLVPLIEATCTGKLTPKDAIERLAELRPSIGRAELDGLIEALRGERVDEEMVCPRSLVDEILKAGHQEIIDIVESEEGDVEGVADIRGKFRPLRISSFADGSRAKVHLTLFPGFTGTEGASNLALKVAELAAGDEEWRHVAVDPRDGESIYVVQVLTDMLVPTVSEALKWALEHGDECADLAWAAGSANDTGREARRRIAELLGNMSMASDLAE